MSSMDAFPNLLGTLGVLNEHGVGNPRDRVSGKVHSLVNR